MNNYGSVEIGSTYVESLLLQVLEMVGLGFVWLAFAQHQVGQGRCVHEINCAEKIE